MTSSRFILNLLCLLAVPVLLLQTDSALAMVISGSAIIWAVRFVLVAMLCLQMTSWAQSFNAIKVAIGITSTLIETWAVWLVFKQSILPADAFIMLLASTSIIVTSLDTGHKGAPHVAHNQVTI
jgi:hypothetical protein